MQDEDYGEYYEDDSRFMTDEEEQYNADCNERARDMREEFKNE